MVWFFSSALDALFHTKVFAQERLLVHFIKRDCKQCQTVVTEEALTVSEGY